MSPFKFRAAAVLTLRRRTHEAAQAELVRRQQERATAVVRLREAERDMRVAEAEYDAQLRTGGVAADLARHRNWILRFTRDRDACRQTVEAHTVRVEAAQGAERRAYQEVRIVERLRDRLERRHAVLVRRAEALAMDQLAVLQYARRMPGGQHCDY